MRRQRGFTLLELLVALAIFGLVSAMAYGGLQSVLAARDQTRQQAARLAALQKAFLIMEGDLRHTVDRPVRDSFGQEQPALLGDLTGLSLTRTGRPNPLDLERSYLARLKYYAEDGKLVRVLWPALDQPYEPEPREAALLDGVQALDFRFLNDNGRWLAEWPPAGTAPGAAVLPRAVEATVELEDLGTVTRLYPLVH